MAKSKKRQSNGGLSIDSLASSQPVGRVFTSGGKYYQTYPDPASATGYTLKSWSAGEPETYTSINQPYSVQEASDNEAATTAARETGKEQIRLNDSTINERVNRMKYDYASLKQQGRTAEANRKLQMDIEKMRNELGWGQLGADVAKTGASLAGPANPFDFSDYSQGLNQAGVLPRAFQNLANNQRGVQFSAFGAQPNPLTLNTLAERLQNGTVAGSVPAGTLPGGAGAASAGQAFMPTGSAPGNVGAEPNMQDQVNASYKALLPVFMDPSKVGSGVWQSQDANDQQAALDAGGKLGFDKGLFLRQLARSHPRQGSVLAA